MIRSVIQADIPAICDIYNYYIGNSVITFEETPVSIADMQERIRLVNLKLPWIVYEEQGRISGYAYATDWKPRSAYRYSAETTIYLDHLKSGRGIGTALYRDLLHRLRSLDLHAIIGGIALPNQASEALHEKLGFQKVAHFKEVGYKFDRWIDVGYWQLTLDKDSG